MIDLTLLADQYKEYNRGDIDPAAARSYLLTLAARHPAELVIPHQQTAEPCPHCRDGKVWTDITWIRCSTCGGSGSVFPPDHDEWVNCRACDGTGERAHSMSDLDLLLRADPRTRCPHCFGAGHTDHYTRTLDRQTTEPCRHCDGTGYREGVIR